MSVFSHAETCHSVQVLVPCPESLYKPSIGRATTFVHLFRKVNKILYGVPDSIVARDNNRVLGHFVNLAFCQSTNVIFKESLGRMRGDGN